jgi:hypothetical protein
MTPIFILPLEVTASREQCMPVKVVVEVPYRKPGNVIEHLPIEFEIFQMNNHLTAVPRCSEEIMRLINIGKTIRFKIVKGDIVVEKPRLKQVAEDIFNVMVSKRLLQR